MLPVYLECSFLIAPSIISKKSLKIPKGGNQNPFIEEEHTTQWPKEKVQRDKQRSTKHTYKTKDRVTRTPLKTGCELRSSVYLLLINNPINLIQLFSILQVLINIVV
jgi:hypothetical protein